MAEWSPDERQKLQKVVDGLVRDSKRTALRFSLETKRAFEHIISALGWQP